MPGLFASFEDEELYESYKQSSYTYLEQCNHKAFACIDVSIREQNTL